METTAPSLEDAKVEVRKMNKDIVIFTDLCEYYGPVVYRYVGTIDMAESLKFIDVEESLKWTKKYHPKHFFGTYKLKNLDKFQEFGGHMKWDVWAVVKEDNSGWSAKPGTKYYERLQEKDRRKKFLPIALTEKQVDEWVAASKSLPGLYSYSY